jgi:hypothetical protein
MEIRKDLGKGIQLIRFTEDSPIQKIMNIGRNMKVRKQLEKEGVGIPSYTKAQKKKIRKDMLNYFNSIENKYGR